MAETQGESRRQRRQRRLSMLEIPEGQLFLTNELLGKGGFGAVYMADYGGRNAAAKVVDIEHDLAGPMGEGSFCMAAIPLKTNRCGSLVAHRLSRNFRQREMRDVACCRIETRVVDVWLSLSFID